MSLIFATQLAAVATTVLAVFAIGTAVLAGLAFRKQAQEVSAIEQQVKDQEEERRIALEREQEAEAYAIQVMYAARPMAVLDAATGKAAGPDRDAVLVMINHGNYTITGIDARLVFAGGHAQKLSGGERLSRLEDLDKRLLAGVAGRLEPMTDTHRLSPWDLGLRIYSQPVPPDRLDGAHPVVQWTDRWGIR